MTGNHHCGYTRGVKSRSEYAIIYEDHGRAVGPPKVANCSVPRLFIGLSRDNFSSCPRAISTGREQVGMSNGSGKHEYTKVVTVQQIAHSTYDRNDVLVAQRKGSHYGRREHPTYFRSAPSPGYQSALPVSQRAFGNAV